MTCNHHFRLLATLVMAAWIMFTETQVSAQDAAQKRPEAPRWTAFQRVTIDRVPERDWGRFYGFTVAGNSTVVEDRFLYPLSEPPLFAGDRIVSVKTRSVQTKDELFEELSSFARGPVAVKVERASRLGKPKMITISLNCSEEEVMRRELGKSKLSFSFVPLVKAPKLTNGDPYSFGTLPPNIAAEIVGFCDKLKDDDGNRIPVLKAEPFADRYTSRAEMLARTKLCREFGEFIFLDKRQAQGTHGPKQYYSVYIYSVVRTDLRPEVLKKGDKFRINESCVLIEDPMTTIVDGRERKVSVLTVCDFYSDNSE